MQDVIPHPARVRQEQAADPFFAAEILGDRVPANETAGRESCDAGGASVPCRWVRREYPGLRGGQEILTLWFSDLVPGGIVRKRMENIPARGSERTVSDSRVTNCQRDS